MATVHVATALAVALHIISAAMAGAPLSTTEAPMVTWCPGEERWCWARGKLWAGGACHTPLEQGPCPDAHWLQLDAGAPPTGACAPRPCPPTQLPSAGRCLEEAEAREMCWSGAVHLDAYGRLRCGASPGWTAILQAHVHCEQASTQTPDYAYNSTAEDGYLNSTDDGYYNATDDGYYNSTYYRDYYNVTDAGYYEYNSTYYGDYYNVTDDGYYNSTYYSGYNFTDDEFNSTDVYDSALDYPTNSNFSAPNSKYAHPPLAYKAMYVKAVESAGDRQTITADTPGEVFMVASAHAHMPLSVRVLAAAALCALLATRETLG